ncbi:N-acyl-phosphatidylethanolamine-hydrolyzing phospholipase D-like [Physella acuta]|uniref:N-acyl-phosphatidylethanolamine-hydrolyzing phospholipase D-like n=1 Tax=Physella acuta TaxID=109671 RepID=UPI0027DDFD65|nr:N-acyl-phosphatidylethanolamine-hydrolyzing phospholipase D-like [Physella acuta]
MDTTAEDLDLDLVQPVESKGIFHNPWETWQEPQLSKLLKFMFMSSEANIPSKEELDKTLPVIKPDFSKFASSPTSGVRHMWVGHATSLVQLDGITLLTDPIFSDRCSPFQWLGEKRYRPTPCTVDQLPNIDCVLISHNHYDHLDYGTVLALNRRFGDKLRWYVPKGLKTWMSNTGCTNVVELSWWQEHIHSDQSEIRIVSTPCQHWCKRSLNDTNKVLWTSWCVIGPKHKFYFAGDTGYCAGFKQIGKRYGPFTLSTIPIGAYNPRWFLAPQHVDPEEAVKIHMDIKSQTSVGIHWGTFRLSKEFYLEPKQKLAEEVKKLELSPSSFITVQHGDVIVIGGNNEQ